MDCVWISPASLSPSALMSVKEMAKGITYEDSIKTRWDVFTVFMSVACLSPRMLTMDQGCLHTLLFEWLTVTFCIRVIMSSAGKLLAIYWTCLWWGTTGWGRSTISWWRATVSLRQLRASERWSFLKVTSNREKYIQLGFICHSEYKTWDHNLSWKKILNSNDLL